MGWTEHCEREHACSVTTVSLRSDERMTYLLRVEGEGEGQGEGLVEER